MIKPIQYIKDIIDLLRDPSGEPVCAFEITSDNIDALINEPELDPRMKPYLKVGDFVVEFENLVTVVPSKDFHKHYEFYGPVHAEAHGPLIYIRSVRQTKPL